MSLSLVLSKLLQSSVSHNNNKIKKGALHACRPFRVLCLADVVLVCVFGFGSPALQSSGVVTEYKKVRPRSNEAVGVRRRPR